MAVVPQGEDPTAEDPTAERSKQRQISNRASQEQNERIRVAMASLASQRESVEAQMGRLGEAEKILVDARNAARFEYENALAEQDFMRRSIDYAVSQIGCRMDSGESIARQAALTGGAPPDIRIAISMLICQPPEASLLSFVSYHLGLGFERIYLFWDQYQYSRIFGEEVGLDPMAKIAADIDGVSVVICDREWFESRVRVSRIWSQWGSHISRDVISRQVLAIEAAILQATGEGMQWMLHIDVDELFYHPGTVERGTEGGGNSLPAPPLDARFYFDSIPDEVDEVTFLNMEAAPEKGEMRDYFTEVTLFKRPPSCVDADHLAMHWRLGRRQNCHFVAYTNGKSAVRLDRGEVVPAGSHRYVEAPGSGRKLLRHTANVDCDPCILHYVNCGYEQWVLKYTVIGAFPDRWFGEVLIPLHFHLQSRDAIHYGSPGEARSLYERVILFEDVDEVDNLCREGILRRIRGPMEWLGQRKQAAS